MSAAQVNGGSLELPGRPCQALVECRGHFNPGVDAWGLQTVPGRISDATELLPEYLIVYSWACGENWFLTVNRDVSNMDQLGLCMRLAEEYFHGEVTLSLDHHGYSENNGVTRKCLMGSLTLSAIPLASIFPQTWGPQVAKPDLGPHEGDWTQEPVRSQSCGYMVIWGCQAGVWCMGRQLEWIKLPSAHLRA